MGNPAKINIELDDLKESEQTPTPRVFPGLSSSGVSQYSIDVSGGKSKKPYLLAMSEGIAIPRALAGLIGGSIAWAVTELVLNQDRGATSMVGVYLNTMTWNALIGFFIGGALRASEDVYVGRHDAAIKGFFWGAGAGLGTGLMSGFVSQALYSMMGGGQENQIFIQIFARTLAFGISGILLGLGISIPSGIRQKIRAAAIGGLVGGLLGGFCFDTFGSIMSLILGGGGGISRMLGLVMTGAAIGYGMGATENIYRDAWLKVTGGPFKGKQFILFKQDSWIGRSPKCDIVLVKDNYVADYHCQIQETPSGYRMLANAQLGAQVLVNGVIANDKILQPGDCVQVGYSQFVFQASSGKKG